MQGAHLTPNQIANRQKPRIKQKMAVCSSSLPVFSAVSTPKLSSDSFVRTGIRVSNLNTLVTMPSSFYRNPGKNRRSTKLNRAGLSEIEPDLNEDPVDRWGINSVDPVWSFTFSRHSFSVSVCEWLFMTVFCVSGWFQVRGVRWTPHVSRRRRERYILHYLWVQCD